MSPTLRIATPAECLARDRLTHPEWGQLLGLGPWQLRERRLRGHAWARRAMRSWWLEEEGIALASCETFATPCALGDGRVGVSEGIASVFVEPGLRKRGLGTALIDALVARLAEEGALAAHLFSDVGVAQYARSGFVGEPVQELSLPPLAGEASWEVEGLLREAELDRTLEAVVAPEGEFVLWPERGQLDWHLERERVYAELLERPRPAWHGATHRGQAAFWCADLKNDRLVVLLLACASDALEPRDALLKAARCVAHDAGLAEVVVWDELALREPPVAGVVRGREESIPMRRLLAQGSIRDLWIPPRFAWV